MDNSLATISFRIIMCGREGGSILRAKPDGLYIFSLVLFIVVVAVVVVKVGVAIPALLLGPLFYIQVGGASLLLEKLVWGVWSFSR